MGPMGGGGSPAGHLGRGPAGRSPNNFKGTTLESSAMQRMSGFWSYVHRDDAADGGRIQRLARDVVAQYELITGDDVELFLDKDTLDVGDRWRSRIDESLLGVAFFVPVLTPRYLLSPECRRELNYFANRAETVGVGGLILPLVYVPTASLDNPSSSDELVQLLRQIQWVSWSGLRLLNVDSSEYRGAVAALAERIARANAESEVVLQPASAQVPGGEDLVDAQDQMALLDVAIPVIHGAVRDIAKEVVAFSDAVEKAGAEMQEADAQGRGFAGRVVISQRLASELAGAGEKIVGLSNTFTARLNEMDEGVRTSIAVAPAQISRNPRCLGDVQQFFAALKSMTASSREGLRSIAEPMQSLAKIENLSRDLRPAFRSIRQGLTIVAEGREVMDEWDLLIDDSGIAAQDTSAEPQASPAAASPSRGRQVVAGCAPSPVGGRSESRRQRG
jgi:hypothetical protein